MNKAISLGLITASLVTVFGILYTIFCPNTDDWNGIPRDQDRTTADKVFNRVYASAMIFSTVGLGHVSPKTRKARILVMTEVFFVCIGVLRVLS